MVHGPGLPNGGPGDFEVKVAADGTNLYLASLVVATGTSLVLNKLTSSLGANWNTSPDQVTVEATPTRLAGVLHLILPTEHSGAAMVL